MRDSLWLVVLMLVTLVLIPGCPPCDPMTMQNLKEIQASPPDSVTICERALAYEEGKKASGEKDDEKSLRNVKDACDCMKGAIGGDSVLVNTCRASIEAFLVYESSKCE
jgi:hypothetical protein